MSCQVLRTAVAVAIAAFAIESTTAFSQIVAFRLETSDLDGNVVESITEGSEFLLRVYTQHVAGDESAVNSGVFAGYLDITYDPSLASIAGDITYAESYSNVRRGDLAVPGLMDNIGSVASTPEFRPIGLDEQHVFSVPMQADAVGSLRFVGSESLEYPFYDVLVFGKNGPVPAKDIDFGAVDLRIDFGAVTLSVLPVPEPHASVLILVGACTLLGRRSGRII